MRGEGGEHTPLRRRHVAPPQHQTGTGTGRHGGDARGVGRFVDQLRRLHAEGLPGAFQQGRDRLAAVHDAAREGRHRLRLRGGTGGSARQPQGTVDDGGHRGGHDGEHRQRQQGVRIVEREGPYGRNEPVAAREAGQRNWFIAFAVISAVFLYTTVVNVIERPDGVKIGACFIAGIILVSLLSRLLRAFELRVTSVTLDGMAARFVRDIASRKIRFIANEPDQRDKAEYRDKIEQIRTDNDIPGQEDFVFVEVTVTDPSEFEAGLTVRGEVTHNRYRVLTLESSSIPNALAALLLHVRDTTGCIPHIYFEWTEGNPFANFLRFFLFGQGEVAPVTREVLREAEPDRERRPRVHTG